MSKNIKVVDEHGIDRTANVIFAFDLDGSDNVVYWIERDEDNNNVFVSKAIKNIDGTFSLLDIEDSMEKSKISEMIKSMITTAVSDSNDKLVGETVTLSDGRVAKFINVSFNKEQRINVQKTYITTVKKEVTKVAETYYDVVRVEPPKVVEEIFPSVTPVVSEPKVENVAPVFPETNVPTVEASPVVNVVPPVVEPVAPVLSTPTVEVPKAEVAPVLTPEPVQGVPSVVESITTPTPVGTSDVVEPTDVMPTPEKVGPIEASVVDANQPLVFNASKETNLNAALGEVASNVTIPVKNIESIREFGVDEPVSPTPVQQPGIAPMVQPEVATETKVLTKKAGFANNKFFMVVAVAFFLASCVFLGYEVFNYFQLVK